MNIYEMFDYGPIVAMDSEWGLMVTYNASYYNVWVLRGEDVWENTECMQNGNGGDDQDIWKICKRANQWLTEIVKGDGEDEEE